MSSIATPRDRVVAALYGQPVDKVPFTVYEGIPPSPPAMTELKRRGLVVVHRFGVFDTTYPNCTIRTQHYEENGSKRIRTEISTPMGDLHAIVEPAGFTSWTHKYLFTDKNDYKALAYYLSDAVVTPRYDRAEKLIAESDDNTILRSSFGLEPLQHLISGGVFGTENFCLEWMENRDEVLKLYEIIVEKRRLIYSIVARAPILHSNYGGNVVPEIVGLENFKSYYVPHYQEAAEIMHAHDKLIGVHFDANCRLFSEDIGATDLDYIEAFTPAPDTDMTMREAREAWPDKVLWINFPSSIHLQSIEDIKQTTIELCESVSPAEGFIIGITENLPEGREDENYRAIMDGIDTYTAGK